MHNEDERARAAGQVAAVTMPHGRVLDAGCGTGQVGAALHSLGFTALTGFDLSGDMLDRSRRLGVYSHLQLGSLCERLPFADGTFDAVVSVGVFAHGHVGAEALPELLRVTRTGGHVVLTLHDDVAAGMDITATAGEMERSGAWELVDRTEPSGAVSEEGAPAPMRGWTWKVVRRG